MRLISGITRSHQSVFFSVLALDVFLIGMGLMISTPQAIAATTTSEIAAIQSEANLALSPLTPPKDGTPKDTSTQGGA